MRTKDSARIEGGYPAYAGIDPGIFKPLHGTTGLPRIRGDRPFRRCGILVSPAATPHTRGSTLRLAFLEFLLEGYPAYAGIDQRRMKNPGGVRRLPRIRGDRPAYGLTPCRQTSATPHTRGSTYLRDLLYPLSTGYPAYAGIDRIVPGNRPFFPGLPRIRGDRPPGGVRPKMYDEATPHTRGSTLRLSADAPCTRGYPAYAGIDLPAKRIYKRRFWLPRIRGDRPDI